MTVTSRISGFHKLNLQQRRDRVAELVGLEGEELEALCGRESLPLEIANLMIENAIGTFSLPLGLGLNMRVNGRDYLVPMAVEEPSVIAAVSFASKLVREAGGFLGESTDPIVTAQVQVTDYGDPNLAQQRLFAARDEIRALADTFHPSLVARGGGAREVEVRLLPAPEGPSGEPILVVHIHIDTRDAMGANLVNTVAEGVAPLVESISGGRVFLRILSNLTDRRLARSTCRIPFHLLDDGEWRGSDIAKGIHQASRFAEADPYRAATHNKGVMNGIDAIAIATGQDWRAIEAGAHAYAARSGRYGPLTTWRLEDGHLVGRIEVPMAVGTVGGPIRVHPGVQAALKLMRIESARELGVVIASVGLAQNLAAVRALGSIGIQRGHMALHARSVALTAGARGDWVEKIAAMLVESGQVKVEKARELLASLKASDGAAA
jgi:hydroxymethylglutaryl-CoA reductase